MVHPYGIGPQIQGRQVWYVVLSSHHNVPDTLYSISFLSDCTPLTSTPTMPRRLIIRKGGRPKRRRSRAKSAKKHVTFSPVAEGILGAGAASITGPTTTIEYLKLVKSVFLYEPSVYRKFVNTMTEYQKGKIDIVEALNTMVILFDGYPNLIRDFNVFLPDEYALEIQEDAVVLKVYEKVSPEDEEEQHQQQPRQASDDLDTLSYITKVKDAFREDPTKYTKFTRILSEYHTKKVNEIDTVKRVVALLRHHPVLVLHFNHFLPDGHEIHMFDNSSYTIEFPVTDGRKAISIKA